MKKNILQKYLSLQPNNNQVQAMYVWLGGLGELRSKTKTIFFDDKKNIKLPRWNYDGSSTGQADGSHSEVFLVPVSIYKDPFRGGSNILVWCETVDPQTGNPLPTNTRHGCNAIMNKVKSHEP